MMNYKNLTTAQLLEEISYLEQVGTPVAVQLLNAKEELEYRRNQKSTIKLQPQQTKLTAEPTEISYTKNARAVINQDTIEFYGREGGEKKYTMSIADIYSDTHLLSFYRSEYLATGITARVLNHLSK